MIPDLRITAVAVALAFFGGYKVADWRLTAQANAEVVQARDVAIKARDDATAAYTHQAGLLAAANDAHNKAKEEAQHETTRLRDGLRDGSLGLRVAVKCPAPAETGSTPGARLDSGTGADLAPAAGQAYFALRDGVDVVDAKLAACQEQLTLISAGSKSP